MCESETRKAEFAMTLAVLAVALLAVWAGLI